MGHRKVANALFALTVFVLTWGFNLRPIRGQDGADGAAGNFLFSIDDISYFAIGVHGPVNGDDGGDGFLGGNGGNGRAGIFFLAGRDISHGLLLIAAPVTGGNGGNGGGGVGGGNGGNGGAGIFFSAGRDITHVALQVLAPVTGGNGGDGGSGFGGGNGGNGGSAIFFSAGRDITHVALETSAPVTGGNGGNGGDGFGGGNGGDGSAAIFISAARDVSRADLIISGPVTGGNGGDAGGGLFGGNAGNGGAGIFVSAGRDISHLKLKISDSVAGGNGGNADLATFGGSGGNGGAGAFVSANGDITDFKLKNLSSITGGMGGNGVTGGNGGAGFFLDARGNTNITGATIKNKGPVTGGSGGDGAGFVSEGSANGSGGDGGNGIALAATGNITKVILENFDSITGSNGGGATGPTPAPTIPPELPTQFGESLPTGGQGGNAVSFNSSDGDIGDVFVKNFGTITGGNGGDVSGGISGGGGGQAPTQTDVGAVGGEGGNGFIFEAGNGNLSNLRLLNFGHIEGGAGGSSANGPDSSEGGAGGNGVLFEAGGNIDNIWLKNISAITIIGGNGGSVVNGGFDSVAGNGGHGVGFIGEGDITNIKLVNRGTIIGGNGGDITSDFDDPKAGRGGDGIAFITSNENTFLGSISNITLINKERGVITGGNGGEADSFTTGNDTDDPRGGNGGNGITFSTGLNITDDDDTFPPDETADDISHVKLINKGAITGGDGGGASNSFDDTGDDDAGSVGGNGGHGVLFIAYQGSITDVTLINCGTIIGGNGGPAENDEINTGGNGGSGVQFNASDELINIRVINYGSITGGEGNDPGGVFFDEDGNEVVFGNGGDALFFVARGDSSSNIVVNNFGSLTGGDAGDGGEAGAGLHSEVSNLTLNNWGNVSGGADGLDPIPSAIKIVANNNTINLRGFSVIHGLIEADDSPDPTTNVLNIALSGVSRGAAAALRAQLTLAGDLNGTPSTDSFTFRGETYQWKEIVLALNTTSYRQQGITPNQKSIGRNLDRFTSTPSDDMRNLLAAVDISGNVPRALEQLSPQRYQFFSDIAFAHANFNTLEIDDRLNNLRSGSESIDARGLSIASAIERKVGFGRNITLALQNPNRDGPWISQDPSKDGGKTVLEAETPPERERRFGTFISGNIVRGDIDGHGGDLDDPNFTTSGLMAGLDYKITHSFVAGLLFSYGHTNADLDARGSDAKVDTYTGGVYAGYQHGNWYGNGVATYSANNYDSHRVVLPFLNCPPMEDRIARGHTSGNHFAVNIDGGYDFHTTKHLTLSPTLGLQYVNLDLDGFNETEAGAANLAVHSQNADSLRSRLGGRLEFRKAVNRCIVLALETRAAWQHEFLDDSRSITSEFIGAGLGPFSVQTTNPERDAALLGTGFNTTFHGFLTLFLDYDAQVGQANYLEQAGRGGVRVNF